MQLVYYWTTHYQ